LIRHFLTRQFLAFLTVGGTAAVLHWLSRIVLSQWLPFSAAVVAAYCVGMTVAFVLNSRYVFSQSSKPRDKQARDFILVNLAFFPLVWGASLGINHGLRMIGVVRYTEALAHGIAVILPTLATFLIYKFFAFKDTEYGRS
jgi:putative flippase GtrA